MLRQIKRTNCPFRSITDLKDFEDNEVIKGPSATDTSQYVPIDIMIKSMTTQEYNWHKLNSQYISDFELEKQGLSGIDEIEDLTDLVTQYESTSPEVAEGTGAPDGEVPAVKVNKNEVTSTIEPTFTDPVPLGESTRVASSSTSSASSSTSSASSPTSVNQL